MPFKTSNLSLSNMFCIFSSINYRFCSKTVEKLKTRIHSTPLNRLSTFILKHTHIHPFVVLNTRRKKQKTRPGSGLFRASCLVKPLGIIERVCCEEQTHNTSTAPYPSFKRPASPFRRYPWPDHRHPTPPHRTRHHRWYYLVPKVAPFI